MTSLDAAPRSGVDTFVRYGLIAAAVIAPLSIAISLFLSPATTTTSDAAYVTAFGTHLSSYPMMAWIGLISGLLMVPAALAVGRVGRAGAPVLGLVGMILAVAGSLPGGNNSDEVLYSAYKSGLDGASITKLYDYLVNKAPSAMLFWLFMAGLLGFLLLGVAALIGRSAAPWAAIALIVAPILVPIAWIAGLSVMVAAGAWVLMTIGMGGVALGLLNPRA